MLNIIFPAMVILALAWVPMLLLLCLSVALAVRIGDEFVYTAPGISRTGPPVGKQIDGVLRTHLPHGPDLGAAVAGTPSLLLFLGPLGRDIDQPHVKDVLLPDLLEIARLPRAKLRIAVLCTDAAESVRAALASHREIRVVSLPNDTLLRMLAIRVTPFSLLVDESGRVAHKGLANNFEHFCLLARGGEVARPAESSFAEIVQGCKRRFGTL